MTCTSCGVELTPENKVKNRRICKDCRKKQVKETSANWQRKNREQFREYRKQIPDDDDYKDLSPVSEDWWGKII